MKPALGPEPNDRVMTTANATTPHDATAPVAAAVRLRVAAPRPAALLLSSLLLLTGP
jgi:hypothetical protein